MTCIFSLYKQEYIYKNSMSQDCFGNAIIFISMSTQSRDTYLHADQSWFLKIYLYCTFDVIKILLLTVTV